METDLFNQSFYPETFYPETYRQKDVEKIVEQLVNFQPLTLVGLPRVGLARILRFILVHPEILTRRLKADKIILVEIDINDLFAIKETNFWQLILKRISDNANSKEINKLYISSTRANDAFTFFDNTKKAVTKLCAGGCCVILFFDRFDRAVSLYSFLFFSHLQSLRDVAKTKINFLFTSNRPLENLSPDIFKGGNLEVFSQKYFLKPSSYIDLLPIIKEFEESRKMNLCKEIKDLVYHYSGGHAQYALLILQILEKNIFNTKNIDSFLKNDLAIFEQGKEIWDFLNSEEKSLVVAKKEIPLNHFLSQVSQVGLIKNDGSLFNPLFEHFVSTQSTIEKESQKELTKKEKALLSILLSRKQELVTREEIINFVWPNDPEEVNDWTVDQLIKRLRKKILILKDKYKIVTIKNQGYKIV